MQGQYRRKVYFWGQEMVIADRLRRAGLALADTVAWVVAELVTAGRPGRVRGLRRKIGWPADKWLKAS